MLENEIKPYDNEADAIVERIRGTQEEEIEEEIEEEEDTRAKGVFLTLIGIGLLGLIGYVGFNYVQSGQTDKNSSNVSKENESLIKNLKEKLSLKKTSTEINQTEKPLLATTLTPSKKVEAPVPKKEEVIKEKNVTQAEIEKVESKKIEVTKVAIVKEEPKKEAITKVEIAQEEPKEEEVTKVEMVKEEPKKVVTKKVIIKKVKHRIVTIKKGDTLASIAEKFYGNPMDFKRIIRANRSIRNQHSHLFLGEKIIVPPMEKSRRDRIFTVGKGNTLASISKRFYGTPHKVQKIVDANYNIKTKDSILHLGQKIYIPK